MSTISPIKTKTILKEVSDENIPNGDCSICLDSLREKLTVYECTNHWFCEPCITKWYNLKRNGSGSVPCPACKKELLTNREQLKVLYKKFFPTDRQSAPNNIRSFLINSAYGYSLFLGYKGTKPLLQGFAKGSLRIAAPSITSFVVNRLSKRYPSLKRFSSPVQKEIAIALYTLQFCSNFRKKQTPRTIVNSFNTTMGSIISTSTEDVTVGSLLTNLAINQGLQFRE